MFALRTLPSMSFLLCMLMASVGVSSANAGTITLSPLRLDFSAKKTSDSVMVRNDGLVEITVETSAVSWNDENSQDKFAPTRDILLAPAIFKIAPGATQTVRFASRITPSEKEQAYRIFFSELPGSNTQTQENQVNTTLNITIPVFVKPLSKQKTAMQWTAQLAPLNSQLSAQVKDQLSSKKEDEKAVLRISGINTGGMHERVTSLSLVGTPGNISLPVNEPTKYVLPDRERHWDVQLTADQEKQLEKIVYTYQDADDKTVTGRLAIKE
jgi:P pilus assembly chaperone PapD